MALGPRDEPYINFYIWAPGRPYDRFAIKENGTWRLLYTPINVGEMVVDDEGIVHAVGREAYNPNLVYATWYAGHWTLENISFYGSDFIGASWMSIAIDDSKRPHVLYFSDKVGEVRYASRTDYGTWNMEVVDTVGVVARVGRGGQLRIDASGVPVVVYTSGLGSKTVHFAKRASTGWYSEIVDNSATFLIHPTLALTKDNTACIVYEWVNEINASRNVWDPDLVFRCKQSTDWSREVLVDGLDDQAANYAVYAEYPDSESDKCGNPHLTFYYDRVVSGDTSERGLYYATKGPPCTSNRPPTVNAGGPYTGYEGSSLTLAATATDPDNDALTYRWDFDNDDVADTSWSSYPTVQHVWGDDYTGEVRVEVFDGKTTSNATAAVRILNLPPRTESFHAAATATATLRIAGEKWHDVSAYLADGGNETLMAELTRQPGKPQEVSFPIAIDMTKESFLRIAYTPGDDKVNGQPNGATPAWLTFTFDSGPPVEMHHTFNVKHPETWNWIVSLNQLMAGRSIQFTATATDPGSDDLTFTWEWGDGSPATARTYYNDGTGPDPYPSPGGTFPLTATDSETHEYAMAGTYDLRLRVTDDDGDVKEIMLVIVIL